MLQQKVAQNGTTLFRGIPVHGMLIHGTSLHGNLVLGNDTFSTCSWNDMVHGKLHSQLALPVMNQWLMTGRDSFWLTELRRKGTKLGEGERQ